MKFEQIVSRLVAITFTVVTMLASEQAAHADTVFNDEQSDVRRHELGLTVQKIAADEFSIVSDGRSEADAAASARVLAARLTLERGYHKFVILHEAGYMREITGRYFGTIPMGTVSRPSAILVIRLLGTDENLPNAIDAKSLIPR